MKILVVHNFYQQPGGEDQVFADECALLESRGNTVERFSVHNAAVDSMGKLELARRTIWNSAAAAELADKVKQIDAAVVHFHNTFPLISPAAYQAVRKAGAAVVQTLHNYRLICPAATFFREGRVCEDCLGRTVAWPAVSHSCYRGNRSATAAVTAMLSYNRIRGTYKSDVDAYIALTQFSKQKFIEAGFPTAQIHVKPNFVDPDPGPGPGDGGYALFVGRLTEEKGIRFLLDAWKSIGKRLPLKVLGDGPLRAEVEAAAAASESRIEYLGRMPLPEIYDKMGKASVLVFPSLWYEGLPRTIVEAFAKGTPVVASRLGSMTELVSPGVNGQLFEPENEVDLALQVAAVLKSGAEMRSMARKEFEMRYTAAQNYAELMKIYDSAVATRHNGATSGLDVSKSANQAVA